MDITSNVIDITNNTDKA